MDTSLPPHTGTETGTGTGTPTRALVSSVVQPEDILVCACKASARHAIDSIVETRLYYLWACYVFAWTVTYTELPFTVLEGILPSYIYIYIYTHFTPTLQLYTLVCFSLLLCSPLSHTLLFSWLTFLSTSSYFSTSPPLIYSSSTTSSTFSPDYSLNSVPLLQISCEVMDTQVIHMPWGTV